MQRRQCIGLELGQESWPEIQRDGRGSGATPELGTNPHEETSGLGGKQSQYYGNRYNWNLSQYIMITLSAIADEICNTLYSTFAETVFKYSQISSLRILILC